MTRVPIDIRRCSFCPAYNTPQKSKVIFPTMMMLYVRRTHSQNLLSDINSFLSFLSYIYEKYI